MKEVSSEGRGRRPTPWLTFALGAAALLLWQAPASWLQFLELSREGLERGEWWRLYTSHLVHHTGEHLLFDLLGFVFVGTFCELRSPERTRWMLLLAASAVGIGVLSFDGGIDTYRGLSGLATALFAFFLADAWRRTSRFGPYRAAVSVLGCLLGAKLLAETLGGNSIFIGETVGFVSVPAAHWCGALIGLVRGAFGARSSAVLA